MVSNQYYYYHYYDTLSILHCVLDSPGKPVNIQVGDKIYGDISSNVTLIWMPPTVTRRLTHYVVKILMSLTTERLLVNTTTIDLEDIPYNEEITVSISAVNGFGESEQLNISFIICKGLIIKFYTIYTHMLKGHTLFIITAGFTQ